MIKQVLLAACFVLAHAVAPASMAATPQEAKAMVEKAVRYFQENGEEKTFAAIDDPNGPFREGDLYVFVHDSTGLVRAHGANPALIGKNTIDLTDIDGKAFVKEFTSVKDTGWVDYKWQNPVSKALQAKTAYIVHDGNFFFCAGAYKQ
jgi:signal transduction histidine kinase